MLERAGFMNWMESLCCVLGQDTLLSVSFPLSTQELSMDKYWETVSVFTIIRP